MGLLGGSDVEESVDASVEEVKERSDDVDVEQMRSPQELIEQVDRLEEVVNGLRQRQEEIAQSHSEDIHELEFGEAVDFSGLKEDIESIRHDPVDLGSVEERLEMLEVDVERLESGFEMDAEELRENIIEEAIEMENRQLRKVQSRLDDLEQEVRDSELEEKVDFSELKSDIDELKQKTEDVDSLIGRDEVEEKIRSLEEERSDGKQELRNRIDSLEGRIEDSSIEEKVDTEQLQDEIQQLKDDLEWEIGEKEHHLRQEIEEKTNNDLEERVAVLEEGVEAIIQEEPQMKERVEEAENKIEEMAEREQEVADDIDSRLKDLEDEKSELHGPDTRQSGVSEEEFNDLKQKVEEMSDLLVKVAKQNN
jgi:DNA repair exonuclease SbcCD ATPase subunit